ncbi:hypothetical protein HK101_010122 [Irineochytrium annulatum]|nr:hypothetical protein HK101_010122 [Irineochytrium annulatum]
MSNPNLFGCLTPYVAPFLRRSDVQASINMALLPDAERPTQAPPPPQVRATTPSNVGERHGGRAVHFDPAGAPAAPHPPREVVAELMEYNSNEFLHHKLITRRRSIGSALAKFTFGGGGADKESSKTPQPPPLKLKPRAFADHHCPILMVEQEVVLMEVEIIGLERVTAAIAKRRGNWSQAIQGTAGRYVCQIVDIVEGFQGEVVKFMADCIHVKWDCVTNSSAKLRQLQEALACGVQLLTELSDFTVELSESIMSANTSKKGSLTDSAILEYAGVKKSTGEDAFQASTPITLRMKVAITMGTVTNVVLGTKDRMDYALHGELVGELSDLLCQCNVGQLSLAAKHWDSITSIAGPLAQNLVSQTPTVATFTRSTSSFRTRTVGSNKSVSRSNSNTGSRNGRRRSLPTGDGGFGLGLVTEKGPASGPGGGAGAAPSPVVAKSYRRGPTMRRLSEGNEEQLRSFIALAMIEAEAGVEARVTRVMTQHANEEGESESPPAREDASHLYGALLSATTIRRVGGGTSEEDMLAPRRKASVVYVYLPESTTLEDLQRAVVVALEEVEAHGGVFHQWFTIRHLRIVACTFNVDESEMDDVPVNTPAINAVKFSFSVRRRLNAVKIPTSIAVTSGEMYHSLLGNLTRSDVLILSDTLSRNLKDVTVPESRNRVLCDDVTQSLLQDPAATNVPPNFSFAHLGNFILRGIMKPTSIHCVADADEPPTYRDRPCRVLIGHGQVRDMLSVALSMWSRQHALSAAEVKAEDKGSDTEDSDDDGVIMMPVWTGFVVLGHSGLGKSMILDELAARVEPGSDVVVCRSGAVCEHGPKIPFGGMARLILEAVASMDKGNPNIVEVFRATAKAASIEDNVTEVLMDSVMLAGLNDGSKRCHTARVWEDIAIKGFIELFVYMSTKCKIFTLVDDYQMLQVVFSRQATPGKPPTRLKNLPHVRLFTLEPLTPTDISDLLTLQWGGRPGGVRCVDTPLIEMIHRVTHGDGLYASVLCSVLRFRANVGKRPADAPPAAAAPAPGGGGIRRPTYGALPGMHGSPELPGQARSSVVGRASTVMGGGGGGNQGGAKEDMPSPLFVDDDGTLRARRWPALDLTGFTFADVVMGIHERMSPASKKVFSTAAVWGQHFKLGDLAAVVEDKMSSEEILAAVNSDLEYFITAQEPDSFVGINADTEAAGLRSMNLGFRNTLIREILLDSLTFLLRQAMHSSVATYLKTKYDAQPDIRILVRLAEHYDKAKSIPQLIETLTQLGEVCYNSNLLKESEAIYERLLGLSGAGWGEFSTNMKAVWLARLAESKVDNGMIHQAKDHLTEATEILKFTRPKTRFGMLLKLWITKYRLQSMLRKLATGSINKEELIASVHAVATEDPSAVAEAEDPSANAFARVFAQLKEPGLSDGGLRSISIMLAMSHSLKVQDPSLRTSCALGASRVFLAGEQKSDRAWVCLQQALLGLRGQPLSSPFRMDVSCEVAWILYKNGDLGAAHKMFEAVMAMATKYDRWGIWGSAAIGYITTSLYSGKMRHAFAHLEKRCKILITSGVHDVTSSDMAAILGALVSFTIITTLLGHAGMAANILDAIAPHLSPTGSLPRVSEWVKESKGHHHHDHHKEKGGYHFHLRRTTHEGDEVHGSNEAVQEEDESDTLGESSQKEETSVEEKPPDEAKPPATPAAEAPQGPEVRFVEAVLPGPISPVLHLAFHGARFMVAVMRSRNDDAIKCFEMLNAPAFVNKIVAHAEDATATAVEDGSGLLGIALIAFMSGVVHGYRPVIPESGKDEQGRPLFALSIEPTARPIRALMTLISKTSWGRMVFGGPKARDMMMIFLDLTMTTFEYCTERSGIMEMVRRRRRRFAKRWKGDDPARDEELMFIKVLCDYLVAKTAPDKPSYKNDHDTKDDFKSEVVEISRYILKTGSAFYRKSGRLPTRASFGREMPTESVRRYVVSVAVNGEKGQEIEITKSPHGTPHNIFALKCLLCEKIPVKDDERILLAEFKFCREEGGDPLGCTAVLDDLPGMECDQVKLFAYAKTGKKLKDVEISCAKALLGEFSELPGFEQLAEILTKPFAVPIPVPSPFYSSELSAFVSDGNALLEDAKRLTICLRNVLAFDDKVCRADEIVKDVLAGLARLSYAFRVDTRAGLHAAADEAPFTVHVVNRLLLFGKTIAGDNVGLDALADVQAMTKLWSLHMLGEDIPYVFAYIATSTTIEFFAVSPQDEVTPLSETMGVTTPADRLAVARCAVNIIRLLQTIARLRFKSFTPLPLDEAKIFANSTIVRRRGYVEKTVTRSYLCLIKRTRNDIVAMYDKLANVPHACHLRPDSKDRIRKHDNGSLTLSLVPVGVEEQPRSEAELRECIRCVLQALVKMHELGWAHNNVRWRNVIFADGTWHLIDFETSSKDVACFATDLYKKNSRKSVYGLLSSATVEMTAGRKNLMEKLASRHYWSANAKAALDDHWLTGADAAALSL